MAMQFAGWMPAPKPNVETQIGMQLLPLLAETVLRPRTPLGQLEMQMQQAQLKQMQQKQRFAEAEQPLNLATLQGGIDLNKLKQRISEFGLQEEQITAPYRRAKEQGELEMLPTKLAGEKAGVAAVEAAIQQTKATTPTWYDKTLGVLKSIKDLGQKPQEQALTFELAGVTDVANWGMTKDPKYITAAGYAKLDAEVKTVAVKIANYRAIVNAANKIGPDGKLLVSPEEVATAKEKLADLLPAFKDALEYLDIARKGKVSAKGGKGEGGTPPPPPLAEIFKDYSPTEITLAFKDVLSSHGAPPSSTLKRQTMNFNLLPTLPTLTRYELGSNW